MRNGPEIQEGIEELERIITEDLPAMTVTDGDPRYNRERLDALEIPLMLKTALMIARSHRGVRKRGSHYRTDYPEKDPNWVKNVTVRKAPNGQMLVDVSPVRVEGE